MSLQQPPNLRQPQQLAAVPKHKLSKSKSIVSIRQGNTESHETAKLQCNKRDQLHRSYNIVGTEPSLSTNHVQKPLTCHYLSDPTLAVSTITKKQMEERHQSSFSSACSATIKEQQKLSVEQQQQVLCSQNLSTPLISPHAYLQKLLVSRGYSTKLYCSLAGGYYCRPTPLQFASYGNRIVNAVRTSNTKLFSALLSAGLSRNPCNKFGESILHMVCRRSNYDLLKVLLDSGSTVQVSDDFGRTPLHDACWTVKPCFKSVNMLMERDVRLLHIVDRRGSPPLEYVQKENWGEWIQFFEMKKEVFWPRRNVTEESEECPPQLVNVPPHSRPVPDPENCATLDDAAMFSNGKKEPL